MMNYGQNLHDVLRDHKIVLHPTNVSSLKEKMDKAGVDKVDRDNAYNLLRLPHHQHLTHDKAIRAIDALDKIGKIQKHYSGNARFLLARATSLISAREKGAALAQHTEAMQRVKARSAEQQKLQKQKKETALGATPSRSPSPPRGTPVQLAPPMRFP